MVPIQRMVVHKTRLLGKQQIVKLNLVNHLLRLLISHNEEKVRLQSLDKCKHIVKGWDKIYLDHSKNILFLSLIFLMFLLHFFIVSIRPTMSDFIFLLNMDFMGQPTESNFSSNLQLLSFYNSCHIFPSSP